MKVVLKVLDINMQESVRHANYKTYWSDLVCRGC